MWKKYLAFAVAMILVLHTVSAPVYAEEEAEAVQSGTVDLETEEKAESEEETDDSEETEQPGEGKNDGGESVQPGQEESGENAGEKQPEESIEEGMEQPEEDAGQEQPGESEGTEPEQSLEEEVDQPGEDIEKNEETESEILSAVNAIGSTGEFQPEGASYKLTYTEVTGGVKITGITGTKEGELKIPAKIGGMDVVEIGDRAFSDCRNLVGDIIIPDSVTVIGNGAFRLCMELTGDLKIPQGVTTIGEEAFSYCRGLTGDLVIPNGVTKIGKETFRECSGLMGHLVIPDSVTVIADSAFSGCSGLSGELKIPEGVASIGVMAFYDCSGFSGKLIIPESLQEIPSYTFDGCDGISEVRIHENMERVEGSAFSHDAMTRRIYVFNRNLVIDNGCFGDYNIIYGYSGSTAEDYVNNNSSHNIFISLDEQPEIQEYHVNNTEELLAAIGSHRRIILADGLYDLGWEYFGIRDKTDLSIVAEHSGKVEILSHEKTSPVVDISFSTGISISGCIMGHESVEKVEDGCGDNGHVIQIGNSSDVRVKNCDLYGCGIWGIASYRSGGILVEETVIRDCMEGIIQSSATNVLLNQCIFSGNAYDKTWGEYPALSMEGELVVDNSIFLNNYNLILDKYHATIADCTFYNNVWDGGTPQSSGICLNGITWQVNDAVLKLGFPLELDKGTIESKRGKVLDYSESAAPWKNCEFSKVQYADGIEKPDKDISGSDPEPSPTPSITSIKLDKTTLTLSVDETAMLKAELVPANSTASITWTSSNTSVAKVENGLVTAVSKGECTITASAGGKSARCNVVVTASGEDDPTNRAVHISGIKPKSKVYDGSPYSYTGTAVLLDTSGNQVSGVSLTCSYSGTFSDGTVYAETEEAPSQAGNYTLSFKLSGNDADRYNLVRSSYDFSILPKKVTITAESVEIEVGDQLPEISKLKYTIDGLIENEELPKSPSLKYSADNISTDRGGKYEIIPYDADGGNDYRIEYVNGILLVGNYGEIPVEDIPNGGVIPEGLWIAGLAEDGYAYTGKAIKPQVRVYDYKTPLREKTDYTIAYTRNTKAYGYDSGEEGFDTKKAPTITVTAKGNYSGKETVTFKIRPLDIGEEGFSADDIAVAYKAKGVQEPIPTLAWNGKKLRNKTDYTVTYCDNNDNELDAVKEVGQYYIVIAGKGNFAGSRSINLTVTERMKIMGKVSVASIKSQPYTGDEIMPTLTVKDGRKTLIQDVHYMVGYSHNTEVGTAYAVITGIDEAGYCGTKRVSFKITGTPIKKASVSGLTGKKFIYEGVDIMPQIQLEMKTNANGAVKPLILGTDYTVTWQKNRNAGTAAVLFTGKGAYTGTLKKTFIIEKFDIKTNADGRLTALVEQAVIPYAKGGTKPKVAVKFKNSAGNWQTLVEGQDYTLSYKNHTAVNDGNRVDKQPTVIVKGKGNFSGTFGTVLNYQIKAQDLGQLAIMAQDKTYQNRKNIYATKVTVTDLDGKTLRAGTDYNKTPVYTYEKETEVIDAENYGTIVRAAGDVVNKNDIVPAGTELNVRIDAKSGGNYTGSVTGRYRITQTAISSASVSIPKQIYTGQAIVLDKSQITVKLKGKIIEQDQYEIVPNSYKNNVKKGTASVTIRGVNNYGGTKIVKFSIRAKGFVWWK